MKVIKNIFFFLLEFVGFFFFSSILVYSVIHCVQLFVTLKTELVICIILGTCTLLSVIVVVYTELHLRRTKESRLSFWINKNTPNLVISYVMLCIVIFSTTNKATWETENIKEIVTVEWTIFGLSLTIFLVWNVIIDYLRRKQPIAPKIADYVQTYDFLKNRQAFLFEIETSFATIVLLTANLFLLVFSTSFVYLGSKPESVLTQNIVRCTFYFTTNTIIMAFIEMLKPLRQEKAELKKANEVKKREFDTVRSFANLQEMIDDHMKLINETATFTNEQKEKLSQPLTEIKRKLDLQSHLYNKK